MEESGVSFPGKISCIDSNEDFKLHSKNVIVIIRPWM